MERKPSYWTPRSIKWTCQTTETEFNTLKIHKAGVAVGQVLAIHIMEM